MNDPRLVIISIDALLAEDIKDLSSLANLRRIKEEGSMVEAVRSMYPSLTHPAHAVMMSGYPPALTGIHSNTYPDPGVQPQRWYNRLEEMQCPTLFHRATGQRMSTAACRWPLTAGGFSKIDYLLPEVTADEIAAVGIKELLRQESSPALWPTIEQHLGLLNGKAQPQEDLFSTTIAASIIERFSPNLVLTHPAVVDSSRHRYGLFAPEVEEAVRIADSLVGMILDAAQRSGTFESTNFIVLGDHGHLSIERSIAFNCRLVDEGLIRVDRDGQIAGWSAYSHSTGLSAHIYLKNEHDRRLHKRVEQLLQSWAAEEESGIEAVFTKQEVQEHFALDGPFSFVIEGDGRSQFIDDWHHPYVRPLSHPSSSHGHNPYRGHQPPLLCMGPAFRRGVVIKECSLLDLAPTAAAILGLHHSDMHGRVLGELLIR